MKINLIYSIYFIFLITITVLISLNLIYGSVPLNFMYVDIFPKKVPTNSTEQLQLLKVYDELGKICVDSPLNSLGFKDYEWKIEKSNNTFRIITLGDSMTDATCIRINDTWPRQLEKKLNELNLSNKFEILNFGKVGFNTKEEVDLFKKYGFEYNPDMVILQYYSNDLEPASTELNKWSDENYKKWLNGQYKLSEETEKFISENELNLNTPHSSINPIRMIINFDTSRKFYENSNLENEWDKNVAQPLLELISICKERNIKLFVITWDLDQGPAFQKNEIKSLLNEYNISFYDFSSGVPRYPNPSIIRLPDAHLTAVGNEIVANKTIDKILKELR